jgi:ABC-type transport system substrate-binding protein
VVPGMSTARFYQSVIHATWVNAKRPPFNDPRVRRALHLLCEKQVLVDVVKDVSPLMMGGFIYPFSEFATPKEQLAKRIGYQEDSAAAIKEAKSLLAAAGQGSGMRPLDFMVRDLNHHKLFGVAIQEMLRAAGIQCNLRTVVESVWFGDAAAGNYDLAVGAIVSSLLDPSDYFNAWYRTDGPQNYSFWHKAEFDKLLDEIDTEVDAGKRMAMIRQAEDMMEQDPPLVPVAWENILDVWYNYVKGHNPKDYFGIYDVVRFDTFWLDKA